MHPEEGASGGGWLEVALDFGHGVRVWFVANAKRRHGARRPKSEGRNPKEIRRPKSEIRNPAKTAASGERGRWFFFTRNGFNRLD